MTEKLNYSTEKTSEFILENYELDLSKEDILNCGLCFVRGEELDILIDFSTKMGAISPEYYSDDDPKAKILYEISINN